MDRETRRHVDEYRSSEAGPLENTLIDDLVGGELNRQEFIARASMFGLSLGTVGLLLRHAGMEDLAQAAPQVAGKVGGTIRVGITAFGGSLEPYLLNEGGSLAFAGMPGEYLTFTNPQGRVLPALATSWKANADATVWTFQIRRGVKFHNGKTLTAQDVVASMRQYVREKSSNAGLTPYFDPAGVTATGAVHRRLPAQVADRRVPVPRQPDDVPGDHPAGRDRCAAGWLGQGGDDRHRPVPGPELRRQEERGARPERRLLGRPAAARRRPGHLLPGQRADRARPAGRAARPRDAAVAAGGPAVQEQLPVHVLRTADLGAPAGVHADRPGPAPRCTGPPGARARDQPAAAARACDARCRADRQRHAVLARLRVDRSGGPAAHAEPQPRPVAAAGSGRRRT